MSRDRELKEDRVFPIQTETGCLLKWAWSTIYLGQGTSSSCHRTDQAPIPKDNIGSFHNLPGKVEARKLMLNGEWPQAGCQYCEKIEKSGGVSDRQYQTRNQHGHLIPEELFDDPTKTEVDPTILEIYFNNTCNMSCLYCGSHFSSKWEEENNKYGGWQHGISILGNNLDTVNHDYEKMLADFWQHLSENNRYKKLRQYQIAGGEPFFQKEFDQSLDFWESHPNPDVTFNMITNLKVRPKKFKHYIDKMGYMVKNGCIKNVQISSSLDCWGPQEEHVRQGLDLNEWQENFEYLLDKPFVQQTINSAISALTIKTLPELVERINHWNSLKPANNQIIFSFMSVMAPPQMDPANFGAGVFEEDFDKVISLMKEDTDFDKGLKNHMRGIASQIKHSPRNVSAIQDLIAYLDELDRRRNTNWRPLFPWLDKDWTKNTNAILVPHRQI